MNYKITFQLKTPICFQEPIMFDGLIAYAYAQENSKEANISRLSYSKDQLIDFDPMPITKHSDGYFMASWMMYDKNGIIEYLGSWKKRWANEFDYLADFGKNIRKVRINNADFKSYDMPVRLVDLKEVWFYFQSNDVAEVERLLNTHIIGLGKKISQGNGLISSFVIEPLDYDPFKKIIRPIPVKEVPTNFKGELNLVYTGYYPPYWMPDNQVFCKVN